MGIFVRDEWAACPIRDCDLVDLDAIGPPLSDTGSNRALTRSCFCGCGIFVWPAEALFVNVNVVAGRLGLDCLVVLCLIFRFSVSLPESKTSPSPSSMPVKKSSLADADLSAGFSEADWDESGEAFSSRFFNTSSNLRGPSGRTKPSSPSSSLSPVRQLEVLGLRADIDELGLDLPSLRVPPNLVPKLPSAHSISMSSC